MCENANGFCDHLCLALPVSSQGTHVCKCAIGFILDVNQRGCVAGKVSTLASSIFITGRNEVVAKVIFLHLFVILFTGGVCLSACWDTTPQDQTPPDQADTPSDQADTPPDQADTPQTRQTPPWTRQTPPGKHTPAYGLRAAGTHPTGMHSCSFRILHCKLHIQIVEL